MRLLFLFVSLSIPVTSMPLTGAAALAIPSAALLTGKLFQLLTQLGHGHGLGFLRGEGAVQSGDLHIHPVLAQGQPGFQSLVPFLQAGLRTEILCFPQLQVPESCLVRSEPLIPGLWYP